MQVVAIYAGVNTYAKELDYVFNIFNNTCNEIGINIQKIDITKFNIENFSGNKTTIITNIFNNIKNSSAVIFVCTAKLLAPSGSMQSFLEHFDNQLYPDILQNKSFYTIITSTDGSELNAGNYIQTVISLLGGNFIGHMLIGQTYLKNIESSFETTQMIERYAEDFYRILKQNRKLFQVTPFNSNIKNYKNDNFNNLDNILYKEGQTQREIDLHDLQQQIKSETSLSKDLNESQVAALYQREIDNKTIDFNNNVYKNQNINNIYNNKNLKTNNQTYSNDYLTKIQSFNNNQNDDISEITKLLSSQYNNNNNSTQNITQSDKILNGGNCKQRIQSLYHYFQPQIAKDMNCIIQINVTGDENFNGYFDIKNADCTYTDGIHPYPEVIINSDSRVLWDVLTSKYTLQKAFMLGKIKVKGNFVVISKFEQIFKFD